MCIDIQNGVAVLHCLALKDIFQNVEGDHSRFSSIKRTEGNITSYWKKRMQTSGERFIEIISKGVRIATPMLIYTLV